MEKKIIAVALVLVTMVTIFVGCGQKHKTIEVNGKEYILATDEYGGILTNSNGKLLVQVTNENGKVQKDKEGVTKVMSVDFPEQLVNGNTLETPYFKFTLLDSWQLNEDGVFVYKENKDIKISMMYMRDCEEKFAKEYEKEYALSKEFEKTFEKTYSKTSLIRGTCAVTKGDLEGKYIEFIASNEDGTIGAYAFTIYFEYEGRLFQVNLSYMGDNYNITEIDFLRLLQDKITMKKINE